ncbi:MAG: RNA polymerase sigma factor [Patescibacteria group bacterium]|nr:RNA polymerase sigma factor [Patescibacteria group bacterium]
MTEKLMEAPAVLLAPMSGDGELSIPIEVEPGVLTRLEEVLAAKRMNLSLDRKTGLIMIGLAAAAAVGVGIVGYKVHQELTRPAVMTDEKMAEFKQVVADNYETIERYVNWRFGGLVEEDKQDILQTVFETAMKHYSGFRPQADLANPVRSWLYRIVHSRGNNYIRDHKKHWQKRVEEPDDWDGPEIWDMPKYRGEVLKADGDDWENKEMADQVGDLRKLLFDLPEKEKLVLYLKNGVEGGKVSNQEIGYILKCTEGAVKSLYVRILRKLRRGSEK